MSATTPWTRSPRPLRTRKILDAVLAPELERYLSMDGVDFAMTDQVEALQVRVRRGIEVLERRLAQGLHVARRVSIVRAVAAGFTASAALCLVEFPLAALAAGILCVLSAALLAQSLGDTVRLRAVRGKHGSLVELARTREQLIEYAARALADASALGAVPAASEPDAAGNQG